MFSARHFFVLLAMLPASDAFTRMESCTPCDPAECSGVEYTCTITDVNGGPSCAIAKYTDYCHSEDGCSTDVVTGYHQGDRCIEDPETDSGYSCCWSDDPCCGQPEGGTACGDICCENGCDETGVACAPDCPGNKTYQICGEGEGQVTGCGHECICQENTWAWASWDNWQNQDPRACHCGGTATQWCTLHYWKVI